MGTGGSDVATISRRNKTANSSIEERTAEMNKVRQWWIAGVGVAALVTVIGAGAVMAQTPSSTPTASATPTASSSSGDSTAPSAQSTTTGPASNEDPAHEANETAEQEAAEDSGQGFHGGRPNEDPAHEAAESAEREAAEDNGTAQYRSPNGAPAARVPARHLRTSAVIYPRSK
jgi:hypothetical protein